MFSSYVHVSFIKDCFGVFSNKSISIMNQVRRMARREYKLNILKFLLPGAYCRLVKRNHRPFSKIGKLKLSFCALSVMSHVKKSILQNIQTYAFSLVLQISKISEENTY